MDGETFLGSLRSAEALVVDSGPYTGLTLGRVMQDRPDAAYDPSLLRGRSQTAIACRAYLKMLAHDELAASLRNCELKDSVTGQNIVQKPPKNSKAAAARPVPISESLALVAYQGPPVASDPSPQVQKVASAPSTSRLGGAAQWVPAWS